MDRRPIGIFDSGIGGLTAFKKVRQLMPKEDIIYFGDTSRVPYGGRSSDTIKQYAAQDIRFLLSHQVKMIVIACGTVSANLPPILQQLSVPYTGVLQPAVEAACRATKTKRIGILATAATIRSCAYEKAIFEILPDAMLVPKACPMFVPLVENGYIQKDCTVTRIIAQEYLAPLKEAGVDTLGVLRDPSAATTTSAVCVSSEGERSFLYCPGSTSALRAEEIPEGLLAECGIIFIGGALLLTAFDGAPCGQLLRRAGQKSG